MTTSAPSDEVWREVIGQLRAFVGRRIADPVRADDLVGEILLRIHRGIGSVDDRERLARWVSRVARNAVVDEYRRAGRSREQLVATPVEEAAEAAEAAEVAEQESGPDDVLPELARCLRPLLAGLPPEQRRAVEMVDLDGVPQAEAARREAVSVSGLKSRVQRGRRRLAALLDGCCTVTLDARGLPMEYAPRRPCGPCC